MLNVKDITDHLFNYLRNLQTLDLSSNEIQMMSVSSLQGLVNLEYLDLSWNFITELSDDTFQDLKKLKTLDLSKNPLFCFPSQPLKPLRSFEQMIFDNFNFAIDCDDIELQDFPRLKTLSLLGGNLNDMDVQHMTFGDISLQELDLSSNNLICPINGTFNAVKATMLDLTDNPINGECLEKLLYDLQHSHIKTLTLGYNFRNLNITSYTFRGLRASELEEITLRYIHIEDFNLSAGIFQGLPYLKTLELSSSEDFTLQEGIFKGLQNLKTLRLVENDFIDDIKYGVFSDLTSLTTLYIQDNFFESPLKMEELLDNLQNLTTLEYLYLNDNGLDGTILSNSLLNLTSLIELDMSQNKITFIEKGAFSSLTKLKILDLSYNRVLFFRYYMFSDLISLEFLNIMNFNTGTIGDFKRIDMDQVQNLSTLMTTISWYLRLHYDIPSLKYLFFLENNYKSDICVDFKGVYNNMPCLQTLHIENKCLRAIPITSLPSLVSLTLKDVYFTNPEDIFKFIHLFPNIQELSLIGIRDLTNKFMVETLPKLSHLEKLTLVDTKINDVNAPALKTLHNLTTLRIESNIFDCSDCKMKEFLDWMKTDRRVQIVQSDIKCVDPISMYGKSVLTLTFGWECNLAFMISVPITCIFAFLAICIGLCVHFRWYIRYCCFLIKLKRGGYQLQVNDEEQPLNIRYDAFVCYNENDRDWIMQQLVPHLENIDPPNFKLCLHERDFMPGIDIFDNILESIETSHKTMLILSPGFAQSEWCYFEMRMAQDHLFGQRRNLLLLVLLHEIPDDVMPRVLRKMLLTQKYIKWYGKPQLT
ncbi:uncharacterized protein LOC144442607 [Glandiceps talaboti]